MNTTTSSVNNGSKNTKTYIPSKTAKHSRNRLDARSTKHRESLVKGFINKKSITVFVGDAGVGKTSLALYMASSISLGREFLGMRVKQVPTMYIGLDMDDDGIGLLIDQISHGIAKNFDDYLNIITDTNFSYYTSEVFEEAGVPFPDFFNPNEGMKDIEKAIREKGAELCVIDLFSDVSGNAEENSNTDMTTVFKNIKGLRNKTGCAFILLHHTGKDQNRNGRGGSAIKGQTDNLYYITKDGSANDDTALKIESVKSRYGSGFTLSITAKREPRLDPFGNPELDQEGTELLQYKCLLRDSGNPQSTGNGISKEAKIKNEAKNIILQYVFDHPNVNETNVYKELHEKMPKGWKTRNKIYELITELIKNDNVTLTIKGNEKIIKYNGKNLILEVI